MVWLVHYAFHSHHWVLNSLFILVTSGIVLSFLLSMLIYCQGFHSQMGIMMDWFSIFTQLLSYSWLGMDVLKNLEIWLWSACTAPHLILCWMWSLLQMLSPLSSISTTDSVNWWHMTTHLLLNVSQLLSIIISTQTPRIILIMNIHCHRKSWMFVNFNSIYSAGNFFIL